ncbi:response regulator transcription factor [Erysipelothrix sp. HDW6C]|uniref:LytR/AlgR family response regulator transcription factor n=1 Tax=Erysipelothrix sp. HDW6C TaxID=2714930 RepID=UPI00140CBA9F|nr:LytTR family DNA-binding domain-containing protein [Erysipelothrix sp. HDW6C]QIK69769.1 response regulator transcription factor [Erysipelothrix sp. HDW6C]
MINIYLCDDDQDIIDQYRYLIKRYAMSRSLDINLEVFYRGEELLFHLEDHLGSPDIIFMDIFMDDMNGIETARRLRDMGINAQIVFLTTSSDFVFEAFDVRSFNYLIKQDTDEERFREVLSKVITHVEKRAPDFFDCSFGAESRRIPYKDITHFEIYRRVMRVHYNGDEYFDFYETMDNLAVSLEEKGFVRVHRSFLVNLRHIVLFKNQAIRLTSEIELPLGKAYQVQVKEAFNEFVSENWSE